MTLFDFLDRHFVALSVAGYVTLATGLFGFICRLVWHTDEAVRAVGGRLLGMARDEAPPRS